MNSFKAVVFGPGDLGRERSGQVSVEPDGLRVEIGAEHWILGFPGLDLSRGGFDDLAIVVAGRESRGQELALHLSDEEFVAALARVVPRELRPAVARLRRQGEETRGGWRRYLAVVAIVVLGGILFFNQLTGLIASLVPVSTEVALGEAIADGLVERGTLLTTGPAVTAVTQVWQAVARGLPPAPFPFRVRVVGSPQVNALAAPGGQIVVFTGLLARMESAEELAGILAHEAAHGLRRHGLRQVVKALGVSAVMILLVGDPGGLGRAVRDLGSQLVLLSYSRDDEREADRLAVEILRRARIDPSRFPDFFTRLEKDGGVPEFLTILSTHPSHGERQRELQALLQPGDTAVPRLAIPLPSSSSLAGRGKGKP